MVRDLDALEMLIAVANAGSLSGASEALRISRTTLTRRIEQLEASLGLALIDRDAKLVTLTAAGSALVREGALVLSAARALEQSAREAAGRSHRLRMAAPSGIGWGLFGPLLQSSSVMLDGLVVELCYVDRVVHPVRDAFDLVLAFEPAKDENLRCRAYTGLVWRLGASRGYLERHGAPRDARELAGHRLCAVSLPGGPAVDAWPLRDGGSVSVAPWFVSNSIETVASMASTGQGIALLPSILPGGSELDSVLEDAVGVDGTLYLITYKRLGDTATGKRFASVLDAILRQIQDAGPLRR
jgi:DNA-binding transcriptional LysR family regulator